ncbi:hypothetical protein QCE73_17365 [Caballeronia sp. LZ029]|nr:hypothetical protein [Caballeronia sp. LZ029]MDR5744924.1 hypothetical protein [Caballeronia sp. LZ029]
MTEAQAHRDPSPSRCPKCLDRFGRGAYRQFMLEAVFDPHLPGDRRA